MATAAETRVADSEADKNLAEAKKYEAEREYYKAEAAKAKAESLYFAAEARRSVANAIQYEVAARGKEREEAAELAKDVHNHVYVFDKAVSENSVKECIQTFTRWVRQNGAGPIEIELQLNSPGGTINDGFALIDFIRSLESDGHEVITLAYGMAASMAGVILQVGNKRVMGRNAFLLIHEGSLGAIGDVGEVEDRVELMHMYHDKILDLFVERASPINPKTTVSFIRKNWRRKDWWLPSELCLQLGFVDEIR